MIMCKFILRFSILRLIVADVILPTISVMALAVTYHPLQVRTNINRYKRSSIRTYINIECDVILNSHR
jgi:hypothetical protein